MKERRKEVRKKRVDKKGNDKFGEYLHDGSTLSQEFSACALPPAAQ
jgi:hypothetical protein